MVQENDTQADFHDTDRDSIGHDPQDLDFLLSQPGGVVLSAPKPAQRLNRLDVICIICNRTIGTGIFRTPTTVIKYTQSAGLTMLFWLFGAITAMVGILVYIEFGLTTPRHRFPRGKISVPRNGGELHYLKDIFKRPAFLTTCVFGLMFVLLGTTAMNALAFGIRVLEAAGKTPDNFTVRGIAIAVTTFAVVLHGTWRQAGLFLNKSFAIIKILILLLIIITGFIALGGGFHVDQAASKNFNVDNAFKNRANDPYGFAESFLAVVFAYSGFNQANYVIGEIDNPRKKYKWPAFGATVAICVLYMLVNVAYFIVVPVDEQISGQDVATTFFQKTYGTLSSDGNTTAPRVLSAFMAISSLGHIIVMTYTAARVKQEIAKEGVLPFRKFIAQSIEVPRVQLGRLFGQKSIPVYEEIPAGALFVHWLISIFLILATSAQKNAQASYDILVSLYSYCIDSFFSALLGLGLIYLRLAKRRKWRQKSLMNPLVSFTAAVLFAIANIFPIVSSWIPPSGGASPTTGKTTPWFTTPTVGWTLIASGIIYWVGFYFLVPRVGKHDGKRLQVHRKLFFHEEHGYPVQWHEQLCFQWMVTNIEEYGAPHAEEQIEVELTGGGGGGGEGGDGQEMRYTV